MHKPIFIFSFMKSAETPKRPLNAQTMTFRGCFFICYCKKDRKVVSFTRKKKQKNRDFLEIALKLP